MGTVVRRVLVTSYPGIILCGTYVVLLLYRPHKGLHPKCLEGTIKDISDVMRDQIT